MAGHILQLRGCTPEPLGNYLKGLGIFRLIAEQADPQARAWWKNGVLHVLQNKWLDATTASAELVCWLMKACRFTPLIAPWQKGTGYLPIGKRAAGGLALAELLGASITSTEYFRVVFRGFATALGIDLGGDASKWPELMKTAGSNLSDAHLLRILRNQMTSSVGLKWLDAVGVSTSRSNADDTPNWFPLLASGGGEASGQYIVNHQQRLKTVLLDDQEQSKSQLEACLFSENRAGALEIGVLSAMYYPAYVKNWNSTQNFLPDGQRFVNPWDFILLLEGTLIWSLAATKRKGVTTERASFPFYCRGSFGGSATIGPKEVEGAEKSIANGELWCPLWDGPSTLAEIERIFGEGRIQVGDRPATRSLDFALATRGLGIDRGIRAFCRYSLLERSGSGRQTTLLAVPSGNFVPENEPDLLLVAELRTFAVEVTNNLCDSGQQPRRLLNARIEFERAWYAVTTQRTDSNVALLELLATAGRLMAELGTNAAKPGIVKLKQGEKTVERVIAPLPSLDPAWHKRVAGVGDTHFRLAQAIAGIAAWGESSDPYRPAVDAIRSNLMPVRRRGRAWQWDETSRSAVWSRGAPLSANLAGVLRRRLIDAQRGKGDGLPLWSPQGAAYADLLAYWNGDIDEARLTDLIHGFALIDSGQWTQARIDNWQERHEPTPDLQTGAVWFDQEDRPHTRLKPVLWHGTTLLDKDELLALFRLPRVYHLLKLCFVGGRLPRRPTERESVRRTGDEPFPPDSLDVLSLLEAGRLADAVQLAARRLRAKGYPSLLVDPGLDQRMRNANRPTFAEELQMTPDQCRRLAGMMLIPARHTGVSAALAIKPESTNS